MSPSVQRTELTAFTFFFMSLYITLTYSKIYRVQYCVHHGDSGICNLYSFHSSHYSIVLLPPAVAPKQHLNIVKSLLGGNPGKHLYQ